MKNKRKAIVLLSGGLDSATVLYLARRQEYDIYCLIFDYGQRHRREVAAARRLASSAGCPYRVIKIVLPWGGSSLLDRKRPLPKRRQRAKIAKEIPSTYVPARNTIFLAYALSWAETIGAATIFLGANNIDFSGYPDCRSAYFSAYQRVIKAGTKEGKIKIRTPLLKKNKAEIIRTGITLGVPYQFTWSCYQGGQRPCGQCDSCRLRQKGFRELGIKDPAL